MRFDDPLVASSYGTKHTEDISLEESVLLVSVKDSTLNQDCAACYNYRYSNFLGLTLEGGDFNHGKELLSLFNLSLEA